MLPVMPESLTPDWLAHRYDPEHDAVHFLCVDRETRRRVPFLTDDNLGSPGVPLVLGRSAVDVPQEASAEINFIFHSAYCCSTLLANAYDRPGRSFSLKEPVILNDIVGWRQRGAEPNAVGSVLNDALRLLARPFTPGEVSVVKPSNVVNGLATALMGLRPRGRAVLLYAPLEFFLGSIASKGLFGRLWVRDLLRKQLRDGTVDLGFEPEDYFLQTDLQVAAVGWLAQHALFARMAATWPDRIRTLDSETLTADPAVALAALDAFWGVGSDANERSRAIADSFSRNAKSGERFDAGDRQRAQRAAGEAHRDEVEKVFVWAQAVAENVGISLKLPAPLIA